MVIKYPYKEDVHPSMVDEYLAECIDKVDYKPFGNKVIVDRDVKIPTLSGLSIYIGIPLSVLHKWREEYKSFGEKVEMLCSIKEDRLINGSLSKKYSESISKLILSSDHGYKEKTETEVSGDVANAITAAYARLNTDGQAGSNTQEG